MCSTNPKMLLQRPHPLTCSSKDTVLFSSRLSTNSQTFLATPFSSPDTFSAKLLNRDFATTTPRLSSTTTGGGRGGGREGGREGGRGGGREGRREGGNEGGRE